VAVPREALADDLPVKTSRAANRVVVPFLFVVMGHRGRPGRASSAGSAGCVERLDLALFVHATTRPLCPGGRSRGRRHRTSFLFEAAVVRELEGVDPVGLKPRADQIRCTVAGLTPWALAIVRQLQCVSPGGFKCSVASTNRIDLLLRDRRLTASSFCHDTKVRQAGPVRSGPATPSPSRGTLRLGGDCRVSPCLLRRQQRLGTDHLAVGAV